MKKIVFILFTAIACTACQKEDNNGDLGAFWKIMTIEEHSTGTTVNLVNESHFWGIQLDLLEIRTAPLTAYYYRFRNTGDSLFIKATGHDKDLKVYGVYNNADERYAIEQLTDKRMTLRSKSAKIRFRKF